MRQTLLFLALSLSSAVWRDVEAAAGKGLNANVWKPLCGVSEEAGSVSSEALNEGTQTTAAILNHMAAGRRAQIFVMKNILSKPIKKSILLQNYFASRADSVLRTLKTEGLSSYIKAASSTAYLKGRLDDFLHMLEKTDSAHNGCLLVASTGSQAPARQGNSIGDTPCGLQPPEPNAKSTTRQYITDTGFQKLVHDQSGGHTITGSGGTQECKLLVAHNSNDFSHASSQPVAFSILGGYLEIKADNNPPKTISAAALIDEANENTKPWASAHDATAKTLKHSDRRVTNQTGKPSERSALSHAAQSTIKKLGNTPEPNSASKTLKAIFGADKKKKIDDTEAELNSEIIPQGVAGLTKDTPLGSIDNLQILNGILTYYEWQAAEGIAKLKQDASINGKKHGTKKRLQKDRKPRKMQTRRGLQL
uniref:Variant surface glycoprotein 1125.4934 n=1 Tax=Trypanosoma brucei TaxID=5691 RepID=A0A1J0RBQ4_9TRYP|nr:variant surface glycoprotein 1125.4934 [Trypanosoma brucei]